jgi:hypothetical protein
LSARQAGASSAPNQHRGSGEGGEVLKYYRIIIPNKYMGLTIPASKLTKEILEYIYQLSSGQFTIEEIVISAPAKKGGKSNSAPAENTGSA